jgi:hypothetical protein
VAQTLTKVVDLRHFRTPYHADGAEVRPGHTDPATPIELNERYGSDEEPRPELFAVHHEVVRQVDIYRHRWASRAIKVDSRLRVHSPSRSSAAMHTSSTAVMVARLQAIKLADSALLPMHRGTCFSCLRWLLMSWQRARWRGCLEALEGAAHHVRLACVAISCRRHRGPRRKPHERRSWRSPRWAPRCPPCSEFLFQSV